MNDDRVIAALRRFEERTPHDRPLPPDARARIEARMEAAFDVAHSTSDEGDVIDLTAVRLGDAATRRSGVVTAAAAAAVIALVATLIVLRPLEPDTPADRVATPVPVTLLEPGTRWGLATGLDPAPSADGAAIASVLFAVDADVASVVAGERVVRADARISTGDVPSLQYLGSVRFVIEPSGSVRVPLLLLDPERLWLDCDATVDTAAPGRAVCGSDRVAYQPTSTTTTTLDTPRGRITATGTTIDWSVDASAERRQTTIWSAAGLGPVRIDIADDDKTARIYELDPPDTGRTGD